MAADAKRKDWVRRVLGVDPGAAPVTPGSGGEQIFAFEGPKEVAKSNRKKLKAQIKKFQVALEPLREMAQKTELASQVETLALKADKLLPEKGAAIDVVRRAQVEFDGMVVELNRLRNTLQKWEPAPLAQAKTVLGAEAAQQSMTQALGDLADQAAVFARISVANPVSAISVHLADLGAKAQVPAQQCQIAEAAVGAVEAAKAAHEQKKAIEKRLYGLEVQINYLSEPVSQKNLRGTLVAERESVGTACAESTTIEALTKRWKELNKAKPLKKAFDESRVTAVTAKDVQQAILGGFAAIEALLEPVDKKPRAEVLDMISLHVSQLGDSDDDTPQGGGSEDDDDNTDTPPELTSDAVKGELESFIKEAKGDVKKLLKVQDIIGNYFPGAFKALFDKQPDTKPGDLLKKLGKTAPAFTTDACYCGALESRFGLSLEIPKGVQSKRLSQLYDLLARLPKEHVGPANGKLKTLQYEQDSDTSRYANGTIWLNEMWDEKKTAPYLDLDEPEKVKRLDFFTAVTLHEVGHAVDDNATAMGNNRENDAFGGWSTHKVGDIADIVYGEYFQKMELSETGAQGQLKELIGQLLEAGSVRKPADATQPFGALLTKWDEIEKNEGYGVCEAIRSSQHPWKEPALKHGGRTYHESYSEQWVSYKTSERDRARISTYQWRSAGEWFAEIYARYHVSKDEEERKKVAEKYDPKVMGFIR